MKIHASNLSQVNQINQLSEQERQTLLKIATHSITQGFAHGEPLNPDLLIYPQALQAKRASFVTLHEGTALRGCIGSLIATHPLVRDVARNAFAAAFEDPRFNKLTPAELPQLIIHISVLTSPEPIFCSSETELLSQLRPGIDGLILEDRGRRGTFLPSVWEQLSDPAQFLEQLRRKAGLPNEYWSSTLKISRYTTESFS